MDVFGLFLILERNVLTLNELFEMLGVLSCIRNYESIADNMMDEEIDRMIKLVKREIELKTKAVNQKHND